MLRKRLFKIYWALQRRIVPGIEFAQNSYVRVVKSYVNDTTRWLDLGCGHQLWPDWIPGQAETARKAALVVGLDPDASSLCQNHVVRHRVVGLQLPFRDASFDLVTANMVFEHLDDPVEVLCQIRRVLRPDGVCIFHTPNARYWQFALAARVPQFLKNLIVRFSESREAKDVYPTHYRINTERSVREVVARAGFRADQVQMVNTSAAGRILLLGPFVVLELLWLRMTRHPSLSHHRTNIIGVIRAA